MTCEDICMPDAACARKVLRVAEESVRLLRDEQRMGDQWIILWTASLVLLRTVGYVLKEVDREADKRLAVAIDNAWDRWKSGEEHTVFRQFIDGARHRIVHFFELVAGQGVNIHLEGDDEVTYPMYLEGFEGRDQVEVLLEAIAWWHRELDVIEAEAAEMT